MLRKPTVLMQHVSELHIIVIPPLPPPPQGPLQDVSALHSALQSHKVSRHEALEKLGSGLYKHMESATEGEWLENRGGALAVEGT